MLYKEDGDIYGKRYDCNIGEEELLSYIDDFDNGVYRLKIAIEQAYEFGYDSGYRNGYDDGHDKGFDSGFNHCMKKRITVSD